MLSFTSQKPQLPIHSINKIMLNSSNFLLKCAPKPYPKVWFYQLVLGGCTTKDIFSFFVFFFFGGQWATFIGPWYVWSLQWYLDKKKNCGTPSHCHEKKLFSPQSFTCVKALVLKIFTQVNYIKYQEIVLETKNALDILMPIYN
jgi:hypothetical protein